MDLSTTYLGMDLPSPFVVGASPLADNVDSVRRLEDAGAAAIVLRSLFEEQLEGQEPADDHYVENLARFHPEAAAYLNGNPGYRLGPVQYVSHLHEVKQVVGIPVIASLNGVSAGWWLEVARLLEKAGADALELNVYEVATDFEENATVKEDRLLQMVRDVRKEIKIPLAVKLSPFYTSLPYLACKLDLAGVDGLVLFNRFLQADIDIEEREVVPNLHLSGSHELLIRVRWIAILAGRLRASLAVTGGVHSTEDSVKAIMAGADVLQMVSALLRYGPDYLKSMQGKLAEWLEEHEFNSLAEMKGCLSLQDCPDPQVFERANYVQVLHHWTGFNS